LLTYESLSVDYLRANMDFINGINVLEEIGISVKFYRVFSENNLFKL